MNKYINSDEIIRRVETVTQLQRKDIAFQVFNISKNNLSNRIRENRLDLYQLTKWAVNEYINLNWLITGRGEKYIDQDCDREIRDASSNDGINLVSKILIGLAEIGKSDPTRLRDIYNYIEGARAGLTKTEQEDYSAADEKPAAKGI